MIIKEAHNYYSGDAYKQDELLTNAERILSQNPEFANAETLVGTGLSGAIAVPLMAYAFNKSFALVRKSRDESPHDSGLVRGNIGETWVFVDDFISSGGTRDRVIDEIARVASRSRFVGTYTYNYGGNWHPRYRW